MRCNCASSWVALGDSVGGAACSPRSCCSGSRSSCFRSSGAAARQVATSINDSRAVSPCLSMLASSASCSGWGNDVKACASVGPMAPRATRCWQDADSLVPIALRRSTQSGLRPTRRATSVGVRPSSSSSEQTTRASSSAVIVRGGALTASISLLCCTVCVGVSITTGTTVAPCWRQRCSRLNPSRTSKHSPSPVSEHGATRSGSSPP